MEKFRQFFSAVAEIAYLVWYGLPKPDESDTDWQSDQPPNPGLAAKFMRQ